MRESAKGGALLFVTCAVLLMALAVVLVRWSRDAIIPLCEEVANSSSSPCACDCYCPPCEPSSTQYLFTAQGGGATVCVDDACVETNGELECRANGRPK